MSLIDKNKIIIDKTVLLVYTLSDRCQDTKEDRNIRLHTEASYERIFEEKGH